MAAPPKSAGRGAGKYGGRALKRELRLKVWLIAAVIVIFSLYLYPTVRWGSLAS